MHFTIHQALRQLSATDGQPVFKELFRHGSMSVEMYKPVGKDFQKPHRQDEIYVIASGHGQFQNGEVIHPFGPGDWLFVPAGVEHRFLEFSEDFATWVIFYGPDGGENPPATEHFQ